MAQTRSGWIGLWSLVVAMCQLLQQCLHHNPMSPPCLHQSTSVSAPVSLPAHQCVCQRNNVSTSASVPPPLHQCLYQCTSASTIAPVSRPVHQMFPPAQKRLYQCSSASTIAPVSLPVHQSLHYCCCHHLNRVDSILFD